MPNYPNSLPSFSTYVDGVDVVKAGNTSAPSREVEALRQAIGDNPVLLNDNISPTSPPPLNINQYLSMLGNIVKTMTGAANWYNANIPLRLMFFSNGTAQTVPGVTTYYAGAFASGLSATENLIRCPLSFAGNLIKLRTATLSPQPAGGALVVTMQKNGADTAATFTIAGGAAAGTFGGGGVATVSYAAGDTISIKLANANAAASAQIGAISFEFDQAG